MDGFEDHADRTRYAEVRRQGLSVGCCPIESRCRSVIGDRMESPGIPWSAEDANLIIVLRCFQLSNRSDDCWKNRAAA